MGAIIAAFRKRFSRRRFACLLYAPPMIDVVAARWESPLARVPEQRGRRRRTAGGGQSAVGGLGRGWMDGGVCVHVCGRGEASD